MQTTIFDKKTDILRHGSVMLFFIIVALIFASFTYKNYISNDNLFSSSTEISYWQSSSFSGSPQVATTSFFTKSIFYPLLTSLQNLPYLFAFCLVFLNLIACYILQISLKISYRSASLSSLVFASCCYFTTNMQITNFALSVNIILICFILAGCVLIFDKKFLLGIVILLISFYLQVNTQYYQFTYYNIFVIFSYSAYKLIESVQQKAKKQFWVSTAIVIIVISLAIFANSKNIFQQYEYDRQAVATTPNYNTDKPILNDNAEILTSIIPNFKGGVSSSELDCNSQTYNLLEPLFGEKNASIIAANSPTYFGKYQFCDWLNYIGIVAVLICLFGMIACKNKHKWWLIPIIIISVLLSFGNIEYFATRWLPLFYTYNSSANILIINILASSILFGMTIDGLLQDESSPKEVKRCRLAFYISNSVVILLLSLFVLFPDIIDTHSSTEANTSEIAFANNLASYMPQTPEYADAVADFKTNYINAIRFDRQTMIKHSAAYALLFSLLTATALYFALRKKMPKWIFIALLACLIISDNLVASHKYFEHRIINSETNFGLAATEISADKGSFRVIDLTYSNIFDDKETCKNFNSLSGDGYCLQRYKTLCDSTLTKELQLTKYYILSWSQRDGMTADEIQEVFSNKFKTPFLDLLNVKYLVLSKNAKPLENTHSLGNCWLVDSLRWAENDIQELQLMKNADLAKTAIINKKYESEFSDIDFGIDSSDMIQLISNQEDCLKYRAKVSKTRLSVFSEIYNKGWNVKIDGRVARYLRVNYALRALIIPKGEHEIEFEYQPKSLEIGGVVEYLSYLLIAIFVLTTIIVEIVLKRKKEKKR